MQKWWKRIALSAVLGILANVPFAVGELLNRNVSDPRAGFPTPLFIALFIQATLFTYLLTHITETLRKGVWQEKMALLILQCGAAGIIGWTWVTLVIDQWPCFFLGGTGC
jgi:predicted MFS family arabinose efflux permease